MGPYGRGSRHEEESFGCFLLILELFQEGQLGAREREREREGYYKEAAAQLQQLRSTGGCPLIGLVKIFATLMKTVDRRQGPTTLETGMTPTKGEWPKQLHSHMCINMRHSLGPPTHTRIQRCRSR